MANVAAAIARHHPAATQPGVIPWPADEGAEQTLRPVWGTLNKAGSMFPIWRIVINGASPHD